MKLIEQIEKLNIGDIIENADLKEYTTYKAGGKALAIVIPDDLSGLVTLLKF